MKLGDINSIKIKKQFSLFLLFLLFACNKFPETKPLTNPAYLRFVYNGGDTYWRAYHNYPVNTIPKEGDEYQIIGYFNSSDYPLIDQYKGHYTNQEYSDGLFINQFQRFPGPVLNNMDFYKWQQIPNGKQQFSFYNTGSNIAPTTAKPDTIINYNFKPGEFYTIYILYDIDTDTQVYTYYIKLTHEGFKNQDFSDEKKGRIRFLNLDHVNRKDFNYDVYFQYYSYDPNSNNINYKGNEKFMQNFNSNLIDSAENVPFSYYDIPDSILNNPIGHEPSTASLMFKFYQKGQSAATHSQPQQMIATGLSIAGPNNIYFPYFLVSSGPYKNGTARSIISMGIFSDFNEFVAYSVQPYNANDGYFKK